MCLVAFTVPSAAVCYRAGCRELGMAGLHVTPVSMDSQQLGIILGVRVSNQEAWTPPGGKACALESLALLGAGQPSWRELEDKWCSHFPLTHETKVPQQNHCCFYQCLFLASRTIWTISCLSDKRRGPFLKPLWTEFGITPSGLCWRPPQQPRYMWHQWVAQPSGIFTWPTQICIQVIFFEPEIDLWCSLCRLTIYIICHYSCITHYSTSWAKFFSMEAVRRGLNFKHKRSYETSVLLLTCCT